MYTLGSTHDAEANILRNPFGFVPPMLVVAAGLKGAERGIGAEEKFRRPVFQLCTLQVSPV